MCAQRAALALAPSAIMSNERQVVIASEVEVPRSSASKISISIIVIADRSGSAQSLLSVVKS